ncbi:Inhibitor of glucose uptake transporter SgrT [Candidatus Pantoea floridensis]|uniref:Inhibitor of glucose uptake transporter SgrT n=1 Tax=Candidatus Pantoea floridensis TaxID=1938870 RepID=A0A286BZ91_9GAMM|nr:inhibitor of glucose uptake transporter SgrT [Enterobacteriaceae bacterium JKS000233]SOD39463.1 Inhibitor of glucose uptake transporter SgrT [Pantoea floridensis]
MRDFFLQYYKNTSRVESSRMRRISISLRMKLLHEIMQWDLFDDGKNEM